MLLQVPDTAIDNGTHSTEGFRTTTHEATVQGVDDTWRTGNEKDVSRGHSIDLRPKNRLSERHCHAQTAMETFQSRCLRESVVACLRRRW